MWDNMVISCLMSILMIVDKNEQKRAKLKDPLRVVYNAIASIYPEFTK